MGIDSFKKLNQIVKDICMDESDLEVLKRDELNEDTVNNGYLFRELSAQNFLNGVAKEYHFNTTTFESNSTMMLIIPIQDEEELKKNVLGFNSGKLIVSNNYNYSKDVLNNNNSEIMICLIPKGKRIEAERLLIKELREYKVVFIEYEDSEHDCEESNLQKYTRALIMSLNGKDPKNISIDTLKKRYQFLREVKDDYFETSFFDIIYQIKNNNRYFSKLDSFIMMLNDNNIIIIIQEMLKQSLNVRFYNKCWGG